MHQIFKKFLAAVGVKHATDGNKFLGDEMTSLDYEFMKFVSEHGRSYGTRAEFEFRSEQFKKTKAEIDAINADPENTFTAGINHFSDYTHEEYKKLLGYRAEMKKPSLDGELLSVENLADTVDWRTKGAVTKVKNQGQCGSCWAFSSTGSIEGADFLSSGTLNSLSEQQLVDCSKDNNGCNGGLMDLAFEYVEKKPLVLETEYPYKAKDGKCKAVSDGVGTVTSYKDVKSLHAPAQLKAAVAIGPVSIAVEADKSVFQNYESGILNSRKCGKKLDHGVLAVGYGDGYFIVKNSWGASWGDAGYLKISDSTKNICGILSQPSYPIA